MLKSKRIEIALQANKLRNGLGKVEETTNLVGQMSEELALAQVTNITKNFISAMHFRIFFLASLKKKLSVQVE